MKKLCLFMVLFFLCQWGFSQNESIEELEKKLAEATTDSTRMYYHKELCTRYQNSNLEKLLYHIEVGMPIASSVNDSLHKVYRGFFHSALGDYYYRKANQDSSFYHTEKAIQIFEELNYKKGVIATKIEYANILIKNGFVKEASDLFYEGIKICEEDENYNGMIACYFGLSNIANMQKEYDKALEYIQKAEPYCSKLNERRAPNCRSAIISNYAGTYYALKEYDKCISYGLEAAELKKELNYLMTLDNTYNLIGNAYLKKDDYQNTLVYYTKAYEISKKLKKKSGTIKAANKLIKTHLEYNDLQPVGQLLKEQEERISKIKNKILLAEYYRLQFKYNARIKNYKQTSTFYAKYVDIKDSIYLEEKNKAIFELETKYETETLKKEKEQALINEELAQNLATKNRRLFMTTLATGILLLMTSGFFFFQLKARKRAEIAEIKLFETKEKLEMERKINQIEKEKIESELKALRSQMNPHFIFNSLNSIQDLILKEETDKSYDYIVLFADLVRSTLNHSNEKFIPIEKEINFLDVYLNLEKLRFKDDFNYQINYTGNNDIKIPSLIIQPFIENSLLHGLLHKKGDKNISIDFELLKNTVSCTITDNGVGRKRAQQIRKRQNPEHQSFAMDAIKKRLEFLSEQHDINATYEIIDLYDGDHAAGTTVKVKIPFKELY